MKNLFLFFCLLILTQETSAQSEKHHKIVEGFEFVMSSDVAGHSMYHIFDANFYDVVKDYPVKDTWVSKNGNVNEIREFDNLFIHIIHSPKYDDVKTSIIIVY